MDRVERLSPERLKRFFLKGSGSQEGYAAVRPELRRMIQFQQLNLLNASYPVKGPLDVIFCRNVMIYFDKPTQYKILSRFAPMMQEDGLLFAGHSESFLHAADIFRSLGKTVYELSRRTLSGSAGAMCSRRPTMNTWRVRHQPLSRSQFRLPGGQDPARRIFRDDPRHAARHRTRLLCCCVHSRQRERHRRHESFHAARTKAARTWSAVLPVTAPMQWKC